VAISKIDEARTREGERLPGGLRLERLIAVGGMAALYAARSETHGEVAVKLLHRTMLGLPDVRARFLREGKLTMAMNHPGIPEVYAMHELDDGTVAIAMELLAGETMQQRIERRGYLAPQEVLAIADGMLAVLMVAHGRGVIHRDIKPENVFLTARGELKVLDFGIAHAKESAGESLTRAGATLGTPAFMSPEQAKGTWDNCDARTDIWAVGATLFASLTGNGPHEKDSLYESLSAAANLPAPKIGTLVPGLRPAVAQVIDRALERDPDDRWPDAATMRDAVRDAWHGMGGTSMQKVWDHIASDVVVVPPKPPAHDSLAATQPEAPPKPEPKREEPLVAKKPPAPPKRAKIGMAHVAAWGVFALGLTVLACAVIVTLLR
jgi:serine/threonine protein kinase